MTPQERGVMSDDSKCLKHLFIYRIEVPAWGVILTNEAQYVIARLKQCWPEIEVRITGGKLQDTTGDLYDQTQTQID